MPPPVSIERWESEPYRNDDRCDLCGSLARVVRVTLELNAEAPGSASLRLCPDCLRSHSTHSDLLESVKRQYPDLCDERGDDVCEVCGAPAEVFECSAHAFAPGGPVLSGESHSFCQHCASASMLQALRRGDFSVLSPTLHEPLRYLLSRGFDIKDVHFHNAYEVVLDRPIPKSFERQLRLPDHVQCYDDHDLADQFVGIGLICQVTNQVISGDF